MINPMMQMLSSLKQNPVQFLMQRRFNLPKDINANDPNAILNYLLSSGQITQQQMNVAYQQASQFKR